MADVKFFGACLLAVALGQVFPAPSRADDAAFERALVGEVQPLLAKYCQDCHSGDEAEAEIDLVPFTSLSAIRQQPKVWLKMREMLDTEQMPPKESEQPADNERAVLRNWVREFLKHEAQEHAGDPGPVILRRLSNAEYNYTIRDLTGVDSLDPTREFPVDGAAGEGFINTGSAQGMSPALAQKYLDAGKQVAEHLVFLPDGLRFSQFTSERDQSDELVARIQQFYRQFTADGGGQAVDLQGIKFDTNAGGLLPLEKYLLATLEERDALKSGDKTIEAVAKERSLNAKYLRMLWEALSQDSGIATPLLKDLQSAWKQTQPDDISQLVAKIATLQSVLWKFNSIGHIGQEGGPKVWMEPVSPLQSEQEFQLPLAREGADAVLTLGVADVADGAEQAFVVWENPRLVGDGRPEIPLVKLAGLTRKLEQLQKEVLSRTADYMDVCAKIAVSESFPDDARLREMASGRGLDVKALRVWLDFLAISPGSAPVVSGHLEQQIRNPEYAFITGWGSHDTPLILANSSDQELRIPGLSKAHSVVMHPSPMQFVAAGWQSPISGDVVVEAHIADAHPECGNGQEWVVQHLTGRGQRILGHGSFGTRGVETLAATPISVRAGDVVTLVVGPREGNHFCDLTAVELIIKEVGGEQRAWNLARDVSGDIQAANPHSDRFGNAAVWHFYQGDWKPEVAQPSVPSAVPSGSLLSQWQAAKKSEARRELAVRVQDLALGSAPAEAAAPDAQLHRQLGEMAWSMGDLETLVAEAEDDPRFFGPSPTVAAKNDFVLQGPGKATFPIPPLLAAGRSFVSTARLDSAAGSDGAVRVDARLEDFDLATIPINMPVIVREGGRAKKRVESAFDEVRNLFPPALAYSRIVPVDEVVTLTLYYRQDDHLKRLMLNDEQAAELDRLWDELFYVSREPHKYLVAFEQIREFATQDRPDLVKLWDPLVEAVNKRAEVFSQRLVETEPAHLNALLDIADRAWRRPLTSAEREQLLEFYGRLRRELPSHEAAIKLTLARVLSSPSFLYKLEQPSTEDAASPVDDLELASRLSYFLWSSQPDQELRDIAETGSLSSDNAIRKQMQRMLRDPRSRRLAVQFACQWLHVRDFDANDDKNEALFPEFSELRDDMNEETVRFFADMIANDGSVLDLLDADHTFLNGPLAKHYGIAGIEGDEWRRVDGVRGKGRGGVLGMATVLASQSGASRTSPILRGNWVYETLLGERLPRPPANVPVLPETVPAGLTERQLIELHSADAACAKCHAKIDPYGFALEQFDAIGRRRADKADTLTTLVDGRKIDGLDGLRGYLSGERREDVVRQFCKKLLGFSLGRELQLSDEPLVETMLSRLKENDYRFSVAVETIVLSDQFRNIRGAGFAAN